MKLRDISASEAQIMKILWEKGEDMTVLDLTEEIIRQYGKEHKRTTIGTFLQRLIEKEYVTMYRVGRYAYVHVITSETEYKEMLAEREVSGWFRGELADFVACFNRAKGISKEDEKKIREILDGLDR